MILVRCTFESGKVKYLIENQDDKDAIERVKQFVALHEGDVAYKMFLNKEEVVFHKKLPEYYRAIMLQPLYDKMKDEYGLADINECDALLSLFFLKNKNKKADGTEYDIPLRIEKVPYARQIEFISKVANLAISRYSIKYPNANEVDGLKS